MSRIARSTLLVAVFFALEKGLGFLRQVFIARQFGLSPELDAFNAANNIPDLLFALISGGAMAMALIPVLSEYLEQRGKTPAWDLFSRVANLIFLATASLSIIIALLANRIVGWNLGIAPGFNSAQQDLVVHLMRLNLVATLLFSMGGLVIAALQANQHFFLPALAPSLYDIGNFFGILILAPSTPYRFGPISLPAYGMGVYGLVYGVILGALLFLCIQIPGLVRYKFRWTPAINLRNPGVQQVLSLMGPRILTVFFIQLVFLAQDNLASRLISGSVTALVYGWLFMQVPETLIGTAIGTVLLPTLSEHITRQDVESFRRTYNHSMQVILSFTFPLAILLALTIRPVISILGFDESGTNLVLWTVRGYLVGLVGHSLLEVAARGFYARQDARTPLFTSALATLTFIALGILFVSLFGAPGIALANSLAYTGEALLLWLLLNRKYTGLFEVKKTLFRVIPVTLVSGGLVLMLLRLEISPLPLAIVGLALGSLLILPFLWPEVKILIKL
jgi:putative peptidoglycan lipid II flippase